MSGPEKPFSCLKSGCGESFTNEDRLAVHEKKHDMELQLGPKGETFVADQTPTPTRFIRNCEEVGLFQDLQNVNPFEETFKRAIESRAGNHNLNLDANLTVTNTDDTLHTPHIFPNLPEETSNTIYSSNPDANRSPIGVQRSSSDESNNHLGVVRCLASSVDEGLNHIENPNKNKRNIIELTASNESKVVKKSFSTTKVKLRRQESIDLPDEINDANMINNSMNVDRQKIENLHNRSDIEIVSDNNIQPRNSQIPVISISEINEPTKNDTSQVIKEIKGPVASNMAILIPTKLVEAECHNSQSMTYLNVSSCIKNNYSKLISQKSIEMALANFTNEAQSKSVDLNNISIEDIPENSSIMRENSKEERACHMQENQSRRLIFIKNVSSNIKAAEKGDIHSIEMSIPDQPTPNNDEKSKVPVIELNNAIASVDTQKGYELILKWPDGKQIYLKEINKDTQSQISDSSSVSAFDAAQSTAANKTTIKNNVKKKLKDMITINSKKVHNQSNAHNTQNSQVILNTFPMQSVAGPENYVILPQILHETPKIPVLPNNYNIIPTIPQGNIHKDCQFLPTKLTNLNSTAQPVIRTVLNGKICEGTNIPLSSNNITHNLKKVSSNVINNRTVNEIVGKNLEKDQKQDKKSLPKDTESNDPIEMKKMGNRAAVLRYRLRGKQKQKKLMETNEMLANKNDELTKLLRLAYAENEMLKKKLGYPCDTTLEWEDQTSSSSGKFEASSFNKDASRILSGEKQSVIFKNSN